MRRKKLLFLAAIPLALSAGAVAISCGNNVNNLDRSVVENINTPLVIEGFKYDNTTSYGSSTVVETVATNAWMFRIKSEGKADFDENGNLTSAFYNWYSMVYASEVKITKRDGTTVVYDNDKAEVSPPLEKAVGMYITRTSEDEKSINNEKFKKDLKEATRVDIKIKDGHKWVDRYGKATDYDVTALDFYYGWMRTKLIDQTYRLENGGSQSLEKKAKDAFSPAKRKFTDSEKYSNEYLYELFDLDTKKMSSEGDMVTGENKEYVSFYGKSGGVGKFVSFFEKAIFSQNNEFVAAPSGLIKTIADGNGNPDFSEATGLAKKMAYYTYGGKWEELLWAGAYYLETVQQAGNIGTVIYKQNSQYAEKDWLERTDTITSIRLNYTPAAADAFKAREFLDFKNGTVTSIDYTELTDEEKKDEFIKNNLIYTRPLRKSSLTRTAPNVYLAALKEKYQDGETPLAKSAFYMNDNYAKLVYGSSLDDIIAGKNKPTSTYFAGTGLRFRSLIYSAINWFTAANQALPGSGQLPWTPGFPTDNKLGGSDQGDSQQKVKTLSDALEAASSYSYVKKDLTLGEKTNLIKQEVPIIDVNEAYKSDLYNQVKIEMTALLDEFYAANNLAASEKVEWIIYRSTWSTPTVPVKTQYEQILATLKSLDSRLNPKLFFPTTNAEITPYWDDSVPVSTQSFAGWNYDYDGIGSGLDQAFGKESSHLFGALSLFASYPETDQLAKTFPTFYATAKWVQKYINGKKLVYATHDKKDGVLTKKTITMADFDKFYEKTNKELLDIRLAIASGYDENGNEIDGYATLAKMWLDYQTSTKNGDLVKLVSELNVLKGYTLGFITTGSDRLRYSSTKLLPRVYNSNYVSSAIDSEISHPADIRKIK